MATPELTIAQAALSASLFRADPTSLSRPQVDAFFPQLMSTLSQCSRPNVQKCKNWIVDNVVPSSARTTALSKFFLALSKSLGVVPDGKRPSIRRRRLYLLYVLNDVLFKVLSSSQIRQFAPIWEPVLPGLFASAAAFQHSPKQMKKLENLVSIWEGYRYFTTAFADQLRDAIKNGTAADPTTDSVKLAKKEPFTLPSSHGDPSTPWYDLPAGTWLPHIIPNSTKPMLPARIKPIPMTAGPADKHLVNAVETLLSSAERLYSKEGTLDESPLIYRNELGERGVWDENIREVVSDETYYGWSREFCEQMKSRKAKAKAANGPPQERSTSKLSNRSSNLSRSPSPRSPKRQRRASTSRSPSRSPRRRGISRNSRTRSPDRSRRSRSYSRSSSRSRSPRGRRAASPPSDPRGGSWRHNQHPSNAPPPIPPEHGFHPAGPPGPVSFPVPPPPPPTGYPGPWPPPLPQQMQQGQQQGWPLNQNAVPPHPYSMGGWGAVPPPPPPPVPYAQQQQQHHQHQYQWQQQHTPPQNSYYGRGDGGYRGRGGRGGYDHGNRGRGW